MTVVPVRSITASTSTAMTQSWSKSPFPASDGKSNSLTTEASKQNLPGLSTPDGRPNYNAVASENFYESMVIAVNKMYATGMIFSSPVVVDNAVYFGSNDGNLYALQ